MDAGTPARGPQPRYLLRDAPLGRRPRSLWVRKGVLRLPHADGHAANPVTDLRRVNARRTIWRTDAGAVGRRIDARVVDAMAVVAGDLAAVATTGRAVLAGAAIGVDVAI